MARPCVLAENLSFPTKYPPCYPLQANVGFLPRRIGKKAGTSLARTGAQSLYLRIAGRAKRKTLLKN